MRTGKSCQHDWLAYQDLTRSHKGNRWLCKRCSMDIDNIEWLERYAAYNDGPVNVCIGVPYANTKKEFLENAKAAWLAQHGKER